MHVLPNQLAGVKLELGLSKQILPFAERLPGASRAHGHNFYCKQPCSNQPDKRQRQSRFLMQATLQGPTKLKLQGRDRAVPSRRCQEPF